MTGRDAYRAYAHEFRRIRQLLREVNSLPSAESRQLVCRAIAVLICSAFESFVTGLAQEYMDGISAPWDSMLPAQQRLVASQIVLQARRDIPDGEINHQDATKVAEAIRRWNTWVDTAGEFAKAGIDARLVDFYRGAAAPRALEKLLVQLRHDDVRFFDWLGKRGFDSSSYRISLQQLVNLRNDTAHGLRNMPNPTDSDIRNHLMRATILVRAARAYCSKVAPDAQLTAIR